jgi:hypothetical protein
MKKLLLAAFLSLLPLVVAAQNTAPNPVDVAKAAQTHSKKIKAEPAPDTPEVVKVGIYLNDVQNIDMRANNYTLDFYLWFKWKNPESDPTATFEFMNHSESWATMITKPTEKAETLPDGWQYQVMHIQARMSEKMDLRAYPFDHQNLLIYIEDSAKDSTHLDYQIEEVTVNPALKIPGFEFRKPEFKSSVYTYPTRFGDTRMKDAGSYSRIMFKLPVYRNELTSFVKNILPIWLAVICGVFSLMLHPRWIDSRFQIAIFSILSLVALQISNGNDLPALQYMNLMDALYVVGYIFLIFLMGELIVATKWIESERDEDNARAKRLDSRFGFIASALFFAVNFYLIFVTFA